MFYVGPLCGPPLRWWVLCGALPSVWAPCVGPLCGSPVRVPCVGPLCVGPLCGSPVWVSRRAASMWHLLALCLPLVNTLPLFISETTCPGISSPPQERRRLRKYCQSVLLHATEIKGVLNERVSQTIAIATRSQPPEPASLRDPGFAALCGALPSVWVPCVGPLCGCPVWVPCVGPLCGSPVWVPRRAVSCCIYSRDASRSFTRSRL